MLVALACILHSCLKPRCEGEVCGEVEFYLLKSYDRVNGFCQIDESKIVLQSKPIVAYKDIIGYDAKTCTFELSDRACKAICDLPMSVSGVAFAVVANDELVYSAYFWPGYSSMSCNWTVADPMRVCWSKRLPIQLGYPGAISGQPLPDRRNDARLVNILNRDQKLLP